MLLPFPSRSLSWSHGSAEVWALSGAIHHLDLMLPDGRRVRPLAEAPWQGDGAIAGDETIAAHLRFLGGEWACVPFGKSGADPVVHGFGTDNCWTFEERGREDGDAVALVIDYPADRPVERLRRTVLGVPGAARVEFTLEVTARRDCVLPIGLHPILAPGLAGEALRIEGGWSHGETFPVIFEPGVSRLAPGARFDDAGALPLADGGTVSFGALLKETTEEAFQLFGVDGAMRIVYPQSGHAVRLEWRAEDYPTCLFWISTGGRTAKPWNGRFRGFGVEPLNARFEARDGAGAIAGGRAFRAGEVWSTSYSIGVEAI
ncbi:hypothetical protein [Oricola sp.]|uniref:hypothetical protein n=1 Tax=Oricola sp. TaxID=1979950 RepID=UPI0035177ED2